MFYEFYSNLLYYLKRCLSSLTKLARAVEVADEGWVPFLGLLSTLKIVLALQLRYECVICGELSIGR